MGGRCGHIPGKRRGAWLIFLSGQHKLALIVLRHNVLSAFHAFQIWIFIALQRFPGISRDEEETEWLDMRYEVAISGEWGKKRMRKEKYRPFPEPLPDTAFHPMRHSLLPDIKEHNIVKS